MAEKFGEKIGVIGAGAWGTALAALISRHFDVILWAYEAETVETINKEGKNRVFLPDIELSARIIAASSFDRLSS